jgi:hypothetical protein
VISAARWSDDVPVPAFDASHSDSAYSGQKRGIWMQPEISIADAKSIPASNHRMDHLSD